MPKPECKRLKPGSIPSLSELAVACRATVRLLLLAAVLALPTACEGAGRAPVDRAGRDATAEVDADSLFLRRMLEHQAGLTSIVHAAAARTDGVAVREEARLIDLRHDVEKDRLRAALRREFADSPSPTAPTAFQAEADSLARLAGREYERAFRERVVAHHREAVRMIDAYLPLARRSRVRQLAESIRENQLRETAALQAGQSETP